MSDSKRPREWWVNEASIGRSMNGRHKLYTACDERPQSPGWIELVERHAYDQLRAELEQAKAEREATRDACVESNQRMEAVLARRTDEMSADIERVRDKFAALKADADALATCLSDLMQEYEPNQRYQPEPAKEALAAYREKWGK